MGCISSKQARSRKKSPVFDSPVDVIVSKDDDGGNGRPAILDSSLKFHSNVGFGTLEKIREESEKEEDESVTQPPPVRHHASGPHSGHHHSRSSKKASSASVKKSAFSLKFGRLTEGEHVAAGWPAWLTAVAGEAIAGWLPLRSDSFERLEKIGQGTYSSVYRARDNETGKMVALKKVRFDNFQPESVRFMAREITILRQLDHPNIMKLEGIITSRLSCSIYLVFEYMEHDLSGLLSCPGIKFTESQIKCYMRQLVSGVEHCHSRGIMHRDIKASNILVNNEGILKIADFGLANFLSARNKQPLTSRVVTLWYRPPELLLGSTNYGLTVDLWSLGCVFAELFIGRPLLKGRTEVEQLHKIFKLCGSPPDEYWKQSKLPLATMFKPQHPYESTLRERCKEFPKTAVNLIETLLSMDPQKRGTASAALESEYFNTKPYACDPSSMPKYPPNKEIDAKFREEAKRKKVGSTVRASGASRNTRRGRKSAQEPSNFFKVVPTEEVDPITQATRRNNNGSKGKGATVSWMSLKPSDTVSEASQMTEESHDDSIRSVPIEMPASSNFAWAKRRKQDASRKIYGNANMRTQKPSAFDHSSVLQVEAIFESEEQEYDDLSSRAGADEIAKRAMQKQRMRPHRPDSFESSDMYENQELQMDYNSQQGRVKSGPLTYQPHRIDARQDSQIHHPIRRSRFSRDL
ncbi:protein IMPAIRED IN BABA-INDUCED STERILITY 1-like [Coffea arabica]|uniref:Protein IMPAIRED IN BABA-INDUCED STERILITY 1-like n=1 Tax=Coffea arabica TaxID=13443 RepID=A0ABM4V565_COFAR|nr:protein IMPAIRED IN BABA-INDUCED STERILITY 1-like [Coffea arabica]